MRRSEQEIRDLYCAAKAKFGDQIGQRQFCSRTGVKDSEIKYHFGDFGTLQETEGVQRNKLTERLPDNVVFGDYAKACLANNRKIPSTAKLRLLQRKLKTRTSSVYLREPGGIIAFQEKFRRWLSESGDETLRTILDYGGWAKNTGRGSDALRPTKLEPHLHPFLPGCLQYLDVLANGQMPPFESQNISTNTLFERRTGDAFRCLGFEIRQLGQGSGRNADVLACAPRERIALIIDAKVRTNGYALGTEDRKFLDYAITHGKELHRQGFDHVYFVVVGPSFRESDLKRLGDYLLTTSIRSIAMITARALMRMVEDSIKDRSHFSLEEFAKEIYGNRIIAA